MYNVETKTSKRDTVGETQPIAASPNPASSWLAARASIATIFYFFGGSHNSTRLPSQSIIQAKRAFKEAERLFREIAAGEPRDHAAAYFRDRAAVLASAVDAMQWDGVEHMESK